MAEIQESSGKTGKSKQKKFSVRVDFTPMVDMNMLLITFFMLCTSLSKPQTMEISMPTNDKVTEEEQTKIKASQAVTLLLGADDKVYYYFGEPNYEDYTSLKETDYSPEGLRAMLLDRNKEVTARINDLKQQKKDGATVVQAELDYVGSITVDEELLEAAGILEYEKVQIVDVNNGSRFETYTICGERGSGMICLNGAAARCVSTGDKIIIMAYGQYDPEEAKNHKPSVVFVDEKNKISRILCYEKHGQLG